MKYQNKKLRLKDIAIILFIAPISASRFFTKPKSNVKYPHNSFDPTFPKPIKIGRSSFIDGSKFYEWLSDKAGQTINSDDNLMTGKHLQAYYQKSHTWIWQNVKAGNLPKPFKINRTNYWLERDIVGDVEEVA